MIPRVPTMEFRFRRHFRKNDPSVLPEPSEPFKIRHLSEKEDIELAGAPPENTSIAYLQLETSKYTKKSAEAMAKYVRISKRLQRIRWTIYILTYNLVNQQQREEMLCYLLPAIQESTSLKELHIGFGPIGGPSNPALGNMLTHTQSLRSLSLRCLVGPLDVIAVAAALSGLKKNTTLRELTLEFL
jgi:hypothetical protein